MEKKKRMTRAGLRVAVAQDVLKSMRTKIAPATGRYLESVVPVQIDKVETSNETAERLKKDCRVCALGACFLSLVAIDNKFDFSQTSYDGGMYDIDVKVIRERLEKLFSKYQLALIEAAFEGTPIAVGRLSRDHEYKKIYSLVRDFTNYEHKYPDAKLRLRRIMKNIIANNGTFVFPEVK